MFQKVVCFIFSLFCALFVPIALSQGPPPLDGPALGPILATVVVPAGAIHTRSSAEGIFQPMAALPGVSMQVTLQFTPDWANQAVVLQSLDGAGVTCNNPTIGNDGTLQFTVIPGMQGGTYRVHIILGRLDAVFQARVPTGDDPPLLVPEVGQ